MRPRLIAVDDALARPQCELPGPASMRPRLIAVDDVSVDGRAAQEGASFNEATAYCRG